MRKMSIENRNFIIGGTLLSVYQNLQLFYDYHMDNSYVSLMGLNIFITC